jgi:hypothetical protein
VLGEDQLDRHIRRGANLVSVGLFFFLLIFIVKLSNLVLMSDQGRRNTNE